MRLKDKVVLITASTRGIGLAIVKKCAGEGARVYMAARNLDRAQEIADALRGVKCVYNDATNPELEFRYCSRCNGYHCYCDEHISNHTHVE